MAGPCPRCAEAEARTREALAERDRALLDLARAREALNAARLADLWKDEQDIPAYPLNAGAAFPVPLRYRLVDAVNVAVKRSVAPFVARFRGR